MKKDLLEITGWSDQERHGSFGLGRVFYGYNERSLTDPFPNQKFGPITLYRAWNSSTEGPFPRKDGPEFERSAAAFAEKPFPAYSSGKGLKKRPAQAIERARPLRQIQKERIQMGHFRPTSNSKKSNRVNR